MEGKKYLFSDLVSILEQYVLRKRLYPLEAKNALEKTEGVVCNFLGQTSHLMVSNFHNGIYDFKEQESKIIHLQISILQLR